MKIHEIYTQRKIYLDLSDIRAQWISEQNGTQREKVSLLRKICKKEKISNFYDLGANYGEFTVGICDVVNKVHAFEPNPIPYTCLSETTKLYNNINCYQKAVSTEDTSADFFFNTKYSGGGRLKEWQWKDKRYKQFNSQQYYKKINIECVNFLNFLKQTNNNKSCLIKIDIEGKELDVVEHISQYLNNLNAKWYIYFESDKVNAKASKLPGKILVQDATDTLIGVL